MNLERIEKTEITQVVEGIRLPFEHRKRRVYTDPSTEYVYRSGEVFIAASDLEALQEQRRYDSEMGAVLLLGHDEGRALEQAGLAIRETRGGYHRPDDDSLKDLLKRLWGVGSE